MGAVRENQEEFVVVLKMDDEESYRKVTQVIEPLLVDSHIDLLDTQLLDLSFLSDPESANATLDIMNDGDVDRLLAEAPPERLGDIQEAVALLRSVSRSLGSIVEAQPEILKRTKDINVRVERIRKKVADATRRSREELAKLGY